MHAWRRKRRRDDEIGAREQRAVERQTGWLLWKRKRERAEPVRALVAQRHPVNSAASKRLTVVPWRRSILEIQPYTIPEPRARSCRRATPRHYAPLRFVPLRVGRIVLLPIFLATRTGQDPWHAHVSQTLHGPRQSVKRGVNNKPWEGGAGIKGEQKLLRSFFLPLSFARRGAGCVDRIRCRFAERKDSQRVRCLARRALIARFRCATPRTLP